MKKVIQTILPLILSIVALIAVLSISSDVVEVEAQLEGVTHRAGMQLKQSTFGTATPQFEIYNQGSGQSMVIRDSNGTPEVYVDADGGMTINDLTSTSGGNVDLNGNSLILDADADTSITADTDDQVDVAISGADDFRFTANTFTALSGSTIAANTIAETTGGSGVTIDSAVVKDGGFLASGTGLIDTAGITDGLVIDSDGDTTISAPTDDQIDFEVGGSDVATLSATYLTLSTGLIRNSTTITVTDGQTITPTTYSGYRLNAAGAVTITLAACSNDFQPLILYGEDAQTITIADSNIRTSDGAAASIGQYDLWVGECINSEWNEVVNIANQ